MFFDKIFNNKQSHADIYIRASKLIDEAQILSNVINTTTSENEFFASYDRLTNILLKLKSYERKIKFSNKPSDDLRNIRKNKSKAIERLNARKNAVPILLDNPDPHFRDAAVLIIKSNKGSVGLLQRNFKIGFNRAMRILEQLEAFGVVGPENGTFPREVLMDEYTFDTLFKTAHITYTKDNNDLQTSEFNLDQPYSNNYDAMDGHDFEYFCADLLKKNGFSNVEVTQGSGDHGVDIFAEQGDVTYAIQCKRYEGSVPYKAIQEAYSAKGIFNKDVAVVMTNSTFTQQGIEDAKRLSVKLWDRDKLNEFIRNATE